MEIKRIDVVQNYYVQTDEPLMEELVRYSSEDWAVLYEGEEFEIKDTTEIEETFQKSLLFNITNDN